MAAAEDTIGASGLAGLLQPGAIDGLAGFLVRGGPAIWAIAALSVAGLTIVIWKLWRLSALGAWRRRRARQAVAVWSDGDGERALALASAGRGIRARVVATAMRTQIAWAMEEDKAREETEREALEQLSAASAGLRALELIATVAPLLGLLGTVLGMIAAFQALEATGNRADPSVLAGGIWQALLTTAAGMAVAIPASAALTWFESVIDTLRHDLEDMVTRIFTRPLPRTAALAEAAE